MLTFVRLLDSIEAEGLAALVTILAVEGSSPREAGARMVVRPSGAFHGTIGGGMLEFETIAEARRVLARGKGPAARLQKSLGPDLGQCCGGRVTLLIETFDQQDRDALSALAAREGQGAFIAVSRLTDGGSVQRRIATADEQLLQGSSIALLPDGRLIERFGAEATPLLLFGAGHVGRAVVLALAPLPFAVRWIDSRREAFPAAAPANVTMVHASDPATQLEIAREGAFVAVMTHSHPLDLAIATQALRGGRFPYVGLIGSATKRARFASRMRAAGLSAGEIGRLVCPIGLRDIAGKEPAVIAASFAAELLIARQRLARRLPMEPARQPVSA